ncbi:hypothetical protein ACVWYH_005201 [Bradyrhizobium sp. GM24.11]
MTVTLPDCTFFIALDFLDLFVARRAFALPGYRVCRVQDSTMRRGVVLAVQLLNIDRMTFLDHFCAVGTPFESLFAQRQRLPTGIAD